MINTGLPINQSEHIFYKHQLNTKEKKTNTQETSEQMWGFWHTNDLYFPVVKSFLSETETGRYGQVTQVLATTSHLAI